MNNNILLPFSFFSPFSFLLLSFSFVLSPFSFLLLSFSFVLFPFSFFLLPSPSFFFLSPDS
ncbi:hypothetical protein FJR08_13560 [Dolichospermum sp. UHCC 0260]|nr:hypothetical protein [Dolichospermum sp. UHCC 0260]